jgi:peptidoglycan/LPS O-acetylase OafA/YrhL
MKGFRVDERTSQVSGRVGQVVLALTQMALAASVLIRAYVLNQPDSEFRDIQIILGLSLAGNIMASLYFGGHYPVLSGKTLVRIYVGAVVGLFIILSVWFGLPKLEEWYNTILPVVLGPAIILGLYHWVAKLGEKRLEKNIEE